MRYKAIGELSKRFVSFILFFVNIAMTLVILISNAQALIVTLLVPQVCIVMTRLLSISIMSSLCSWRVKRYLERFL
jgi:hypothetical protein